MSNLSSYSNLSQINTALDRLKRTYASAGEQTLLDIEQRLSRLSRAYPVPSLGDVARQFETTRCALAVHTALNASNRRMVEIMAQRLAEFDFSAIWGALWEGAKEVALYIGGGAAMGATVGGALGALAAGVGAVPGAIVGASVGIQIATAALTVMGLVCLVEGLVQVVPEMCRKMGEGFALAWRAGQLPDSARAQSIPLMKAATEAFAEGKILLIIAILSAISALLAKKDLKLIGQLGQSKLGPGFASWVQKNRERLIKEPQLQRKSAGAEGGAAKAPPPAKGAPEKAPEAKAKDKAKEKEEGEAGESCACLLVGKPVNPISGSKILADASELDFVLPAPLPFAWQRVYSSGQRQTGTMGQGWSTPLSFALQVNVDSVVVLDPYAREITFSLPAIGQSLYSPSEKITLARTDERSFELSGADGERKLFAIPDTGHDIARLVALVDANGNQVAITYNKRQLPELVEDGAGNVFTLAFDDQRGHPRLVGISVQRGPQATAEWLVHYQYDDAGNLSQVSNGLGEVTRQFAYRNHVMVEHSEPGGLVSRYEYDEYAASGKVTRNWTNSGQSWSLRYLAQETVVTDNLGREQRFRFDHKRRFVSQVDAAGGVTTRQLDRNGNLLRVTDAGGRSTSYRYDGRSRVIRIEQAGQGTGIVYDNRFDKPALITDAMGATTVLRYDDFGNLASVTDALGQKTSYQYDAHGLPVRVTDAAGGVKRLDYNRAAQLISYTDCSNNSSYFSYDDKGRLVRVTDALGNVTAYEYDPMGRLLALTEADGATQRYEYDGLGRLVASVDPAGRRTRYELDSDGQPLKRVDALGGVLEYRYDDARRVAELINENGDAYRFVYDALDRLTEETGFDARLTRYRYDDSGLAIAKEEYGSAERSAYTRIDTQYLRDNAGQLVEKILSRTTGDAQAEQVRLRYAYDPVGRMTQAINADAEVNLRYDAVGQLVGERTTTRDAIVSVGHAYDELGNRIQTILPDGRIVNNLFYGSGHLHQINIDGDVVTDIERDKLHRATSLTQGALTSQLEYDPVGRLLAQVAGQLAVGQGAEPLIARRYAYDDAGNLLTIDDKRNGLKTYSYDVIGRIMTAVQPGLVERFAFDPAHNLLDATLAATGRVENNRLRVFEDKRYDYDAHGNLTEKRTGRHTCLRLEWNAAHQLVKSETTRQAQETQPTVQTAKYAYDPFGRRIAKKDAFGTTRFVWDGNRLLCEARGQWERVYIYEPDSFVPLAQVDCVRAEDTGAASDCTVHYLHTDHLGTPNEVTDREGALTWAASYQAWGNVLLRVEMASDPDSAPSAQPLRFQGQYHDSETGLHYNRFRYYDADCGRFVSLDPIGLTGGNNLYQYAANPVAWIDPLGLSGYLFRGDDNYSSGAIGRPIDGKITTKEIVAHLKAKGDRSLTSFSEKMKNGNGTSGAEKFSKNIVKVSGDDLAALEKAGQIETYTADQVKQMLKNDPAYASKADDYYKIMTKNNEVLVHGQIPGSAVKKCKC